MSLIALRRDSPFRPASWRTRLAAAIAGHPDRRVRKRLLAWADETVEELLRLERRALDGRHPLARARALLEPDKRVLRLEVEARLLAGEASIAIAKVTGVEVDAVEWYHSAHFDVRDRLAARGYMIHVVLCPFPIARSAGPPYDVLPWFGYLHGPAALEPVLDALRHWDMDRSPPRGGTAVELSQRALRLRVKAAVLARLLPVNDLGATDLRALLSLAGVAG